MQPTATKNTNATTTTTTTNGTRPTPAITAATTTRTANRQTWLVNWLTTQGDEASSIIEGLTLGNALPRFVRTYPVAAILEVYGADNERVF